LNAATCRGGGLLDCHKRPNRERERERELRRKTNTNKKGERERIAYKVVDIIMYIEQRVLVISKFIKR